MEKDNDDVVSIELNDGRVMTLGENASAPNLMLLRLMRSVSASIIFGNTKARWRDAVGGVLLSDAIV